MNELSYEQFLNHLVYDVKLNKPTNPDAKKILFPKYHTNSVNEFVNYIISVSEYYKQHIVVAKSNLKNNSYEFKCSVNNCGMVIKFSTKKGTLVLNKKKSNFQHSLEDHKIYKPKFRIKEDTFEDLKELNKHHGDLKEFKITHPDLEHCRMKYIYDERTKANKTLNNIEYIINCLSEYNDFRSVVVKNKNDIIIGCVVINKIIIKSNYCDIIVIDDTVGVNTLNYPIENVVSRDPNGCLQLVAFGLLSSKSQDGFEEFFYKFKQIAELERTENNLEKDFIKIVVCDRCKAQSNAIMKVFDNCHIIFCREHIIRNVKNNNQSQEFLHAFQSMLYSRSIESERIFKEMLYKLSDSKFKHDLIEDYDHYAPSSVDKLFHRGILTSNSAETSFSVLKTYCKHLLQPLMTTLQKLVEISRNWMIKSIEHEYVSVPEVLEGRVPPNIGKWAINYILNEMKESIYINSKLECNCMSCVYKLPCRHFFASERQNGIKRLKLCIEKEYLNFDKNKLSLEIYEPTPCLVEEVDKDEEELDVISLVQELYSLPNTLKFRNRIANQIINYIKTERYKNHITPSLGIPPPGHIKYSQKCNVSKRYNEIKKNNKEEKKPKK